MSSEPEHPTLPPPRPVKFGVRDRWSRTAIVGLAAIAGLTVLGVVGTVCDRLSGSDLVALGTTFAAILSAVSGRPGSPGATT